MKLTQLTSFSSRIEINKYAKSVQGNDVTLTPELLEKIKAKFNKAKWQSITTNARGFSFYGKKKRDLGCDSLTISIIGDKYVKHVLNFSNTNNAEVTFFQINH